MRAPPGKAVVNQAARVLALRASILTPARSACNSRLDALLHTQLLMHVEILERILLDHQAVRIVLSASWVRLLSFKRARGVLPASLQAQVIGATWHSKMPRAPEYGYDLQTRYEQIRAAATRAGMTRWLALDDDPDHSWPEGDERLIRCDSAQGLGLPLTQDERRMKLAALLEA